MTILTIVLTITGILGQGGDLAFSGFSPLKDERVLKKMVEQVSRYPEITSWKDG